MVAEQQVQNKLHDELTTVMYGTAKFNSIHLSVHWQRCEFFCELEMVPSNSL